METYDILEEISQVQQLFLDYFALKAEDHTYLDLEINIQLKKLEELKKYDQEIEDLETDILFEEKRFKKVVEEGRELIRIDVNCGNKLEKIRNAIRELDENWKKEEDQFSEEIGNMKIACEKEVCNNIERRNELQRRIISRYENKVPRLNKKYK